MRIIFYKDLINENPIMFWAFVLTIITIIILTIIFVRKEIKK